MAIDLNSLTPAALKAAMQGGTAGWGKVSSAAEHVRYKVALPKIKARRQCTCGCGGKATHACMANGIALTRACELGAQRWVRTGKTKPSGAHPSKRERTRNET